MRTMTTHRALSLLGLLGALLTAHGQTNSGLGGERNKESPLAPIPLPNGEGNLRAVSDRPNADTAKSGPSPALPDGIAERLGQLLLPPMVQDRLGLDETQQEQIGRLGRQFVQKQRGRFAPLAAELRNTMRELQEARQKEDQAGFEGDRDKLRRLAEKLAVLRAEFDPEFLSLLTDEQKDRYTALKPELARPELFLTALRASRRGTGPPRRVADAASLRPLTELGNGEYLGVRGGLYPDGKNERPTGHDAAGRALAARIRALDAEGKPDARGKIVLLTIGMSNTMQASAGFQDAAATDPGVNPQVVIVNGAQGGQTAARTQDPDDHASGTIYWSTVDDRLKSAGVTRAQVQAAWVKQADANPTEGFPEYAHKLENELVRIVQVLHARFPNLKLVYLSSRTFGGFATTPLNPEPYAYESGFAVKGLIERQIKGDPALNFDAQRGPVTAPWLSWGSYLWANGTGKRADGFYYAPSDFRSSDGTHESPAGQAKVGRELLKFFKTDATTRVWFVGK